MPEETVTPEAQVAETPAQETTPTAQANTEPKPEPDWRAAYTGLQRSLNKAHQRTEGVLEQNKVLIGTVELLKKGQSALLTSTLGEDKAKEFEAEQSRAQERATAIQAAQAVQQFVIAQTSLFIDTLKEAGVDPNDPAIDWAKDTSSPQEWAERVAPSVRIAIRKANEERIRKTEEGIRSKTAKEVKEEAEALTQQQLKEAGVDRIDTAKGSSTASRSQQIAQMDLSTQEGKAAFDKMYQDVVAGRLKI